MPGIKWVQLEQVQGFNESFNLEGQSGIDVNSKQNTTTNLAEAIRNNVQQ